MFIHGEAISIIFVQPILCPKPHKAFTVLKDAIHRTLREALFKRDMFKFYIILLGVHVYCPDQANQDEQNDEVEPIGSAAL